MRKHIRIWLLLSLLLVPGALAACTPAEQTMEPLTPDWVKPVHPLFQEIYDRLGGVDVLGFPIREAAVNNGFAQQYTENALLIYDSSAPATQQYSLAPLGLEFYNPDPPLTTDGQFVQGTENGLVVYKRFEALYRQLDGTRYVGRPISHPFFDEQNQRIVQYFENLGFYTSAIDLYDTVHLLPYGLIDCDQACREVQLGNTLLSSTPVHTEPFLDAIETFGRGVTGAPLSEYYRTENGEIEQVYENAILYAPVEDLSQIGLRPLPEMIGIQQAVPVPPITDENLIFYAYENSDVGYNVPLVFDNFICSHGGWQLSGPPITERFFLSDGITIRQCFKNYCLDFVKPEDESPSFVQVAPLGQNFMEMGLHQRPGTKTLTLSEPDVSIAVWEEAPFVESQQQQTIHLKIIQPGDQAPVPNLDSTLTVMLPDGMKLRYTMPPTDDLGQSSHRLPTLNVPNGSLISYTVCLDVQSDAPICKMDAFTVWSSQ
jgi:hypothetical protein